MIVASSASSRNLDISRAWEADGVFTWLLSTGMNKFLASPLAIEASIVSNFLLNNYWPFRERKSRTRKRIKGLKFNAVSLVATTA